MTEIIDAQIAASPCIAFAEPFLRFEIRADLNESHFLTSVYGGVAVCADESGNNPAILGMLYPDPDRDLLSFYNKQRTITLLLPLTKTAIDVIEETRMKNSRRDVYLKLRVFLAAIYLQAYVTPKAVPGGEELTVDWTGTDRRVERDFRIERVYRISSSDWVSIFQECFRVGKYALIEVPLELEEISKKLEHVSQRALVDRLVAAAKALVQAELLIRKGEWRQAIGQVRDVVEAIEKGTIEVEGKQISLSEAVKGLIEKSGLPMEAGQHFSTLIDQLKGYTSATHHIVDRTGKIVDVEPSFDKEDAIFAFGTASLLLNILTNKLAKITA